MVDLTVNAQGLMLIQHDHQQEDFCSLRPRFFAFSFQFNAKVQRRREAKSIVDPISTSFVLLYIRLTITVFSEYPDFACAYIDYMCKYDTVQKSLYPGLNRLSDNYRQ